MSEDRRKRLTLIATILGSTVVFLDSTVVNVALPAIQRDLDTGLAAQQWVVEAYLLTLVSVLLVGGSLGDLYGRKRLFVIGLAGFGAASVLCAIAPTTGVLIAARGLQGLAGALLVPGSLAIIAATFSGDDRGRAVGTWTAWSGISTVAGPAGGGLLVEAVDWRAVFWINVPVVIGTIWLALRAIEESSDPQACPGVDYVGIGLSALGLGGTVFALIQQSALGWGDPAVWAPLAIGIVALAAFVAWEARAHAPMLPLDLFGNRNFAVANLATLAVYAALFGASFFITIFLQQVAGYSPFEAGLATTPITVLLFLLSPRFGELSVRIGPRALMGLGPIVAGIGLLLLLRLDHEGEFLADVLPALVPFGVGLAMTVAPLTSTVLNSVADRRAGVASGINNAVARVAGLLAIAGIGVAISVQFAATIESRVEPGEVGPRGERAIEQAKERPLAGPRLRRVPQGHRPAIEAAVTASSEAGFHLGMGIGGGLAIAGGLVALAGIRNPPRAEREAVGEQPQAAGAGAG